MTLKEYCEMGAMFGMDDQTIIYNYIRDNHLEAWAIQTMAKLGEDRVNDLDWKMRYANTWATSRQTKYLIETYGWEDGQLLDDFELFVIMNSRPAKWGETFAPLDERVEVPSYILDRLKERVPQLNVPLIYFREALNSLHNLGIYFKDEKED